MSGRDSFLADFNVSRETSERLDIYANLLTKWNKRLNIVAPSTIGDLWNRHFRDSAQVLPLIRKTDLKIADLGSGGGFPGLVLAIALTEKNPDTHVMLVESDERKCTFLRTVLRETESSATVLTNRIEALEPLTANVVSARALAPLDQLLSLATQHLAKNGRCLFLKGKTWAEELTKAQEAWHMNVSRHPSVTDPSAALLEIEAPTRDRHA